ncbi:MAG: TolC family protein [Microscillaceae bacterium]|nr:TolC family protein [Microscillaceae bacterium]
MNPLKAQTSYDSTLNQVLTFKEFYQQIVRNHPVARQAQLFLEEADQEIRIQKGNFDPKLALNYDRKEFDEKVYFNTFDSKVKVPVWAAEIYAGFKQNHGVFLNPENYISDPAGQGQIGISIPITQSIIVNTRRAALEQARYLRDISENERIKLTNKLLLSAAKDYWEWYFQFRSYQLLDSAYRFASQQLAGVKTRVALGELAAIDSVQALVTFQNRGIELQQASINLKNARIRISYYLWNENQEPLELREEIVPQIELNSLRLISDNRLEELKSFAQNNHPELQKLRLKLAQLQIDEKVSRSQLLPQIELDYTLYSNTAKINENTNFSPAENYQIGVNFNFPLFLRKERGKLQKVQIKQDQTNLDLQAQERDILNQIDVAFNELQNIRDLIDRQSQIVQNYRRLRDGELRKFINGESDLFLINSRENSLIDGQIKLESLKSKLEKTYQELIWSSGKPMWE